MDAQCDLRLVLGICRLLRGRGVYLKIYAVLSTPSVLRAIKLPINVSFLCVGHEAPYFFYVYIIVRLVNPRKAIIPIGY